MKKMNTIDLDEDMEELQASEEEAKKAKGPRKSCMTERTISIISFLILVTGACFSIDWSSAIYLLAGCLYFSQLIGYRALYFILCYGAVILIAEIVVIILTFTTSVFKNLTPFQTDLMITLGFGCVTKDPKLIALNILPEVYVVGGLLLVWFFATRGEENDAQPPKSMFLCHLWFWLMIAFLIVVYMLGTSGCYLLISCTIGLTVGMLMLQLISWGKAESINTREVWLMVKVCTTFSTLVLLVIYCAQVPLVRWVQEPVRNIVGINPFATVKVGLGSR